MLKFRIIKSIINIFYLNCYMNISLNSYISSCNNSNLQLAASSQYQPAFGSAKARKLIEKVLSANSNNFRGINATFDDMVAVYQELGYDVIMKRGSHAVVPLTTKVNLPLVIPHGNKYVHPLDLRRLQCVLNGDLEKALNVH